MKKLVTVVASAGLGLGLSACGGSNGPEQAVQTMGDALVEKDYETVCDTFDPEMVETLEDQGGKGCATLFEENEDALVGVVPEDANIDIEDSEISDDETTATVTVKNQDGNNQDIELVKVEDEWKITFE